MIEHQTRSSGGDVQFLVEIVNFDLPLRDAMFSKVRTVVSAMRILFSQARGRRWFSKVPRECRNSGGRAEERYVALSRTVWLSRIGLMDALRRAALLRAENSCRGEFLESDPNCGRFPDGVFAQHPCHQTRVPFGPPPRLISRFCLLRQRMGK